MKESPQHVEVNLSELKGYEQQVIVELIKETNTRLANKALQCNHDNCRGTSFSLLPNTNFPTPRKRLNQVGIFCFAAIILYQADKLSSDALLYIRWILERYRGCNKVFFCCNDISKLQPIKSLCTIVQLLPPSYQEVVPCAYQLVHLYGLFWLHLWSLNGKQLKSLEAKVDIGLLYITLEESLKKSEPINFQLDCS